MTLKLHLFAVWCAIGSLVSAVEWPHSIPTEKKETHASLARPYSSLRGVGERPNFYWYGNFTVGLTKNAQLLLDTGSPHVLMNPGVYKPSPDSKPYYFPHFEAEFEGINKKGTGTAIVKGNIVVDHVSNGVLTNPHQPLGNITSFKSSGDHGAGLIPGFDGIIGFIGYRGTEFFYDNNASRPVGSWFDNLCRDGVIPECRFGMAFGTNHEGVQVIGGVDESLIKTKLTRSTPMALPYGLWSTRADITLDNKIFLKNQTIVFDTGTTNIQAPSDIARQIFHKLGYPYVRHSEPGLGGGSTFHFLNAFYPCDKPPLLGFSIPAEHDLKHSKNPNISKKARIFNILKSEWPAKHNGGNNCTAVLSGSNDETVPELNATAWIAGQPFYQGHYIDHHIGHSLGFADLVNPSNVGRH